jgi:hypothetical protein
MALSLALLDKGVPFSEGEPDWDRHQRLLARLRAQALRSEADRIDPDTDY